MRRDVCDLGNKNYNRVVAHLLGEMHRAPDPYLAFVNYLPGLTGEASRLPSDADVVAAVARKPLYTLLGSKKLRYILARVELGLRDKFDENVSIATDNLTVEHIMPVHWARTWKLPSGTSGATESYYDLIGSGATVDEAVRREMEIREAAKHTLGNLTLLTEALNPSIGNESWETKRARIGGSLLALNRHLAEHPTWSERDIEARGGKLAAVINLAWPSLAPPIPSAEAA